MTSPEPASAPPGAMSAALLLADGRFPSGGHAHSGGLEPAVGLEGVDGVASLRGFLVGRLASVGTVSAAFGAAANAAMAAALTTALTTATATAPGGTEPGSECLRAAGAPTALLRLDAELDARTPSPAQRTASRRLGRQALRAGRRVWPSEHLQALASEGGTDGMHQAVVMGAVAAVAGMGAGQVALLLAHEAVLGPATAAVRLLGLDPFAVHATVAGLGQAIEHAAALAASHAFTAPGELPACMGPLLDISAERHATWEVRLFAS